MMNGWTRWTDCDHFTITGGEECGILEVEGELLKAAEHRKRAAGALQLATDLY